jgi:hypothetical protein
VYIDRRERKKAKEIGKGKGLHTKPTTLPILLIIKYVPTSSLFSKTQTRII